MGSVSASAPGRALMLMAALTRGCHGPLNLMKNSSEGRGSRVNALPEGAGAEAVQT